MLAKIRRALALAFERWTGREARRRDEAFAALSAQAQAEAAKTAALESRSAALESQVAIDTANFRNRFEVAEARLTAIEGRLAQGETTARSSEADAALARQVLIHRVEFLERCLGFTGETPKMDQRMMFERLLDVRLGQVESRICAIMEGPFHDRLVETLGARGDGADAARRKD